MHKLILRIFLLLFLIRKEITLIDHRYRSIIFEFPFSFQTSSHALASLSILHPSLLTWFVIDRVFLDLFDYSFLLDLPLESFECAFDRFAFFYDYKCQIKSPPYKMMGEFNQFPGECQVGLEKRRPEKGAVLFFSEADLSPYDRVDSFGCEDLFRVDFQDIFVQDSEISIFAHFDRSKNIFLEG